MNVDAVHERLKVKRMRGEEVNWYNHNLLIMSSKAKKLPIANNRRRLHQKSYSKSLSEISYRHRILTTRQTFSFSSKGEVANQQEAPKKKTCQRSMTRMTLKYGRPQLVWAHFILDYKWVFFLFFFFGGFVARLVSRSPVIQTFQGR